MFGLNTFTKEELEKSIKLSEKPLILCKKITRKSIVLSVFCFTIAALGCYVAIATQNKENEMKKSILLFLISANTVYGVRCCNAGYHSYVRQKEHAIKYNMFLQEKNRRNQKTR